MKPTATRQRSPPGPAWQTDAMVLVEAADYPLELGHTPEETKARRPKVYYRVELAEGILRGAARRPPPTSKPVTSGEGGE